LQGKITETEAEMLNYRTLYFNQREHNSLGNMTTREEIEMVNISGISPGTFK
jgi:hypothetical protein